MRDADWKKITFGSIAFLAACWVLFAWLNPVSKNHYNPSKAYSSQQGTNADFTPPPNIDADSGKTKTTTDKEIEQWRASRSDLAAQWKAADMSQLAFRIGVLGVVLLAWTIAETLGAGKELRRQNEIAINASMPFLDVIAAKAVQDRHNHGSLEIAVRNLGTSAAKDVIFVGTYTRFKRSDDMGVFHDGEPIIEDVQSERIAVSANAYNVIDVPFFDWDSLEEHLSFVSDSEVGGIFTVEQVLKHIRFKGEIKFTDHMGVVRGFKINLYQFVRYGKDGYDLNGVGRHPRAGYYEKEYGNST